ncbi:MAG: trigger factor [Cyclobacteriaceae bacterium]|nr:trigger factor [Cyclobacteriaceae bacterium]
MEITLEKKNKTEGLLTIRLAKTDYQQRFEEKLKEYARHAQIKGFRQGKVPSGLIKKMYGKSILADEIQALLNQHVGDYIRNNKLNIVGDLMPLTPSFTPGDVDTLDDIEMQFHIGMADDFKCELSDKIKLTRYRIEVADKAVEETVENLRKRFAKTTYPEISEAGNDLMGSIQSEDGSLQAMAYLKYDWLTPEAQKLTAGRKKDDEIELLLPDMVASPEYLSRMFSVKAEDEEKLKGRFKFKVLTISRSEPAEINQELFDRVFGKDTVTSEEAFLQKIRETIERNYAREAEALLHHEIEDYLIEHTKISLPENFLRNWLKADNEGKITDEVLDKEFPSFLRSLKWSLIKKKIAEEHQVSVATEEVTQRAANMLIQEFGTSEAVMSQLDKLVNNYLTHENGRNFNRLYDQIQLEKIMGIIKDKIKISEKTISFEEFRKIAEKHQH